MFRNHCGPGEINLPGAIACAALLLGTASLALPVTAKGDDIVRLQLNGVIDQVNAAATPGMSCPRVSR